MNLHLCLLILTLFNRSHISTHNKFVFGNLWICKYPKYHATQSKSWCLQEEPDNLNLTTTMKDEQLLLLLALDFCLYFHIKQWMIRRMFSYLSMKVFLTVTKMEREILW